MQAIARWGNFFNQELYGPPTTLPWGIADRLRPPDRRSLPVRPRSRRDDPLPSAVPVRVAVGRPRRAGAHLAGSRVRDRGSGRATCRCVFFIWYGVVRFVLEFLRSGNWTFFGVPTAQIVSAALFIAGRRIGDRADPAPPARAPRAASSRRRRPDDGTTRDDGRAPTRPTRRRRPDDGGRPARATRPRHRVRRPSRHEAARADSTAARRRRRADATAGRARSARRRSPPRAAVPRGPGLARSTPEARRRSLYRCSALVARFVLFGLFRFRIRTAGQEHLPHGRLPAGRRRRTAAGWTRSW